MAHPIKPTELKPNQELPVVPKETLNKKALISGINGIIDGLDFMMFFVLRMTKELTAILFSPPLSYILGPLAALASIVHFGVDIHTLTTDKKKNKKTGAVEFKKYNVFRTIRTGYTAIAITAAITAGTIASILGTSAALGATIPLTFLTLLSVNSIVNFTAALYYHFKSQKSMPEKTKKAAEDYRNSRAFRSKLHIFIGTALGILALASGLGFLYGYSMTVIGMGVLGCSMLSGLSAYFLKLHFDNSDDSTTPGKHTDISLKTAMAQFGENILSQKKANVVATSQVNDKNALAKEVIALQPTGGVTTVGKFAPPPAAPSNPKSAVPLNQNTTGLTMTVGAM